MRKNLTIVLAAFLVFSGCATSNINKEPIKEHTAKEHKAKHKSKMADKAGPLGPFTQQENFPKSYFLIHENLPFMVGLTLFHPMSKTLNLTEQQKSKLQEILKTTMPVVLKKAKEIKQLELALADDFINRATPEDMEKQVDAIGKLRIALSKKMVHCMDKVRKILTQQQFEILLGYAAKGKS